MTNWTVRWLRSWQGIRVRRSLSLLRIAPGLQKLSRAIRVHVSRAEPFQGTADCPFMRRHNCSEVIQNRPKQIVHLRVTVFSVVKPYSLGHRLQKCIISGFRHGINANCCLLGYYATEYPKAVHVSDTDTSSILNMEAADSPQTQADYLFAAL